MGDLVSLRKEWDIPPDFQDGSKRCTLCNEVKPVRAFAILYSRSDNGHIYRRNECRPCRKLVAKRPDQLARSRARNRVWNLSDKAKALKTNHRCKKLYGITLDAAKAVLAANGGRCGNAGCGKQIEFHHPRRSFKAVVDHDHTTGKFRGVLCDSCNKAAGAAGDSAVTLRGLVDYLDRTAK